MNVIQIVLYLFALHGYSQVATVPMQCEDFPTEIGDSIRWECTGESEHYFGSGISYAECIQKCEDYAATAGSGCCESRATTWGRCAFFPNGVAETGNGVPDQSATNCSPAPTHYWTIIGNNARDDKPFPECQPISSRHSEQSNSYGNELGVACCNNSGAGSRPGCVSAATFGEAEAKCESEGLRLCTKDEIEDNATKGQGCSFDAYLQWTSTPCEVENGLRNQNWNYEDEHVATWQTEFFSENRAKQLYQSDLLTHPQSIDCDIEFRVQRDNTQSRTSFSFMTLHDGKIFNVNMEGKKTNMQYWNMGDDCRTLTCYDYEQSSPRGYNGYCPSEFYEGTTPKTLEVLLLRVHFRPEDMDGSSEPRRNKYTFKGTTYALHEGSFAPTPSPTPSPSFAPSTAPTAEEFILKVKGFHGDAATPVSQKSWPAQQRLSADKMNYNLERLVNAEEAN